MATPKNWKMVHDFKKTQKDMMGNRSKKYRNTKTGAEVHITKIMSNSGDTVYSVESRKTGGKASDLVEEKFTNKNKAVREANQWMRNHPMPGEGKEIDRVYEAFHESEAVVGVKRSKYGSDEVVKAASPKMPEYLISEMMEIVEEKTDRKINDRTHTNEIKTVSAEAIKSSKPSSIKVDLEDREVVR